MISLGLPAAAALAVPAAALWWLLARRGQGRWWRAACLAALVLAATRPLLLRDDGGSDVILVLDRSASMGQAVHGHEELIRLAADGRRHGDRLAVIAFGTRAALVQAPSAAVTPRLAADAVDPQGSDLDAALDAAAALAAPGRTARVVVASDGEATGADPRRAAGHLALLGARLDVLPERRPPGADAAVVAVEFPGELRLGASFIGVAEFASDRSEVRAYRIRRGDRLVASGSAALAPGRPAAIAFTDRPAAPGLAAYTVELDAAGDRQEANNTARAWVRITPGERVLVVGGDGSQGNIARAIAAAGMAVATRAEGELRLGDLLGSQAVVLADVPASRIGRVGMLAIAHWVEHLGGGLVMTGGKRAFGCGGWHRSPVEPLLPVSLEVRDEHRLMPVAMAIAIDRSGSMSAIIPGGRQKIELAAEAAAAAIEQLGPRDRVAVFAVDTAPHLVLPMTLATDPQALAADVLGMQSQGGGIYIYEALAAAGQELLRTSAGTRHVLLFADASDSEEPGDYAALLAEYRRHGITVSVVGMGTDADCHAGLLTDVAKRGGGRLYFCEDVADLPRLFAQEAQLVARNPWVEQAVAPRPEAGALAAAFGWTPAEAAAAWPQTPGYNLTYPRQRAAVLAWCDGDPRAPALAVWNVGTGRVATLALPLDAADAPALPAWDGYVRLLGSAARYAAGGAGAAPGAVLVRRRGSTAEIRLELDPAQADAWPAAAPELVLVDAGGAEPRRLALARIDHGVFSADIALPAERPVIPAVAIGGTVVSGPPLALPMPAEAAPHRGLPPGDELLADLARIAGGTVRGDLLGIWDNPPSAGTAAELAPWVVAAALVLLLAEVAVRRLGLAIALPRWRWSRRTAAAPPAPATAAGADAPPGADAAAVAGSGGPAPPPPPPASTLDAMSELRRRR